MIWIILFAMVCFYLLVGNKNFCSVQNVGVGRDQPDRPGAVGAMDHDRPVVHCDERRGVLALGGSLSAGPQAAGPAGAHGHVHRPNRL